MDNNTGNTKSENTPDKITDTLSKNRSLIPVGFALVIIFFFFSFCEFKCNSVKVASLSGINLVTGSHVKMEGGGLFDNPYSSLSNNGIRNPSEKDQKVNPNIWAILAFISAIGGVWVFFKKIKNESFLGSTAGAIGVVSLLILRSVIKGKIEQQGGGMVAIETDFLFGYWASLLAFIVAGGISYLRLRQEKNAKLDVTEKDTSPKITPIHVNIITKEN